MIQIGIKEVLSRVLLIQIGLKMIQVINPTSLFTKMQLSSRVGQCGILMKSKQKINQSVLETSVAGSSPAGESTVQS
jgi:hypothetical protein